MTSGNITRYAGAVGFSAPEYAITLHSLGNLSTFAASYYHKVSNDIEFGGRAVHDSRSTTGGVSLEVGIKTYLVGLQAEIGASLTQSTGQRGVRQGQDQQRWCPQSRLHSGFPTRRQGESEIGGENALMIISQGSFGAAIDT